MGTSEKVWRGPGGLSQSHSVEPTIRLLATNGRGDGYFGTEDSSVDVNQIDKLCEQNEAIDELGGCA